MRTVSAQIGRSFASRAAASSDAGRLARGPQNLPGVAVGDLHPENRLGALDLLLLIGFGRLFRIGLAPLSRTVLRG
jgi:hypothetical protein